MMTFDELLTAYHKELRRRAMAQLGLDSSAYVTPKEFGALGWAVAELAYGEIKQQLPLDEFARQNGLRPNPDKGFGAPFYVAA